MRKAFTLVELLVAVAIIIIVGFGILINFQRIYREYKFNEYAFLMEALVRSAKAYAMEKSRNVNICINGKTIYLIDVGTSRTVNCTGTTVDRLVVTEDYINLTGSEVGFDPRGFALRLGSLCIDNGQRYVRVSVSRWGAIRVEEARGVCS